MRDGVHTSSSWAMAYFSLLRQFDSGYVSSSMIFAEPNDEQHRWMERPTALLGSDSSGNLIGRVL